MDILEMCARLGIVLTQRRGGTEWHGRCPVCGCHDKSDRLIVWPFAARIGARCVGRYACRHECGTRGDAISFAIQFLQLTYAEACQLVLGRAILPVEKRKPGRPRGLRPIDLFPDTTYPERFTMLKMPSPEQLTMLQVKYDSFWPLSAWHVEYLSSRGIAFDLAQHFGLKSSGDCICIPLYSEMALIGIKYRNTPMPQGFTETPKLRFWAESGSWGGSTYYSFVKEPSCKTMWLVESELDAIMLSRWVASVLVMKSGQDQIAYKAYRESSGIIISPDLDDAGEDIMTSARGGIYSARKPNPAVSRLHAPHKDVGDFVKSGGDIKVLVENIS